MKNNYIPNIFNPLNFYNKIVLQKCNLGQIIESIIKSHNNLTIVDPYEYIDRNKVTKIIKRKYTNKQLKYIGDKYKPFYSIIDTLGLISGWSENKETITIDNSNFNRFISNKDIYSLDSLSDFKTSDVFKVPFNQFFVVPSVESFQYKICSIGLLFGFEYAGYKTGNKREYNLVIFNVSVLNENDDISCSPMIVPLTKESMYDNAIMASTAFNMKLKFDKLNRNPFIPVFEQTLSFTLNILRYIIETNMSNHNISSGKTIEPSFHSKDEIQPWDVSSRQGEPIGSKEHCNTINIDDEEYEFAIDPKNYHDYPEIHNSPRPHMRRAHAHNYWCGSGENKHLEERWLTPIEVNHVDRIGPDEMPVVFHKTTDK